MNLDLYFFTKINSYAKKSAWLDFFAIFCAEYLGFILLFFLLIYAITTYQWELFYIPVFAGLFTRFLINEVIYLFYQRKRPLEVLTIASLIKKPFHPSFPSGHASFFFGVSFALLLFSLPLAIAGIIASVFICASRIFSGVHWPSDILGGAFAGLIVFFIFQQLV